MSAKLQGRYYVTPTGTAVHKAWKLFDKKAGPYYELRQHGLKLAHFPDGKTDRLVVDLDWDWIDGTGDGHGIGELRIDDKIGGHENLRMIFYVADKKLAGEPLPRIWVFSVFPKKTNRFTNNELRVFRAQKKIIVRRHYSRTGND